MILELTCPIHPNSLVLLTSTSSSGSSSIWIASRGSTSSTLSAKSSGGSSSSKGGNLIRLKWRRSLFSLLIIIHIVDHWEMYTGSITHGISLTKVMAPVMWYST